MGKAKSPAKWIKTVLFGKKSSKANNPKGKEKAANEREVLVAVKAPEENLGLDHPVASHLTSCNVPKNDVQSDIENREAEISPPDTEISFMRNENEEFTQSAAPDTPERSKQEEAATKAQAAFRGYLARRAFRALKGIIRLQALIRGHLVRRQAASTLHCMLGIVKFQALIRGRKVRKTDIGLEVDRRCMSEKTSSKLENAVGVQIRIAKLSLNAFGRKIFAASPRPMPLQLKYDSGDPNSVLCWLERWSSSQFWKPAPQSKKAIESKPQKKQGTSQKVETTSWAKRSNPRGPVTNGDNISVKSSLDIEKSKRSVRKVPSHPVEPSLHESPQTELEKVKRNLRKVHNPVVESTVLVQPEVEHHKPKQSPEKVLIASDQNVLEQSKTLSDEKMKDATIETTPEQLQVNEAVDLLHDTEHVVELKPSESHGKNEVTPLTNKDPPSKQDSTKPETQKSSRKASTPAKQERADNGVQSSPTLPSYMAVTESAKAKLRGQGSPRLGQDEADKNNITRRHSLPSSTGSKSGSSPRTQRPAQASSKAGNRSDRSLLSSREGHGKVVQAEWKR